MKNRNLFLATLIAMLAMTVGLTASSEINGDEAYWFKFQGKNSAERTRLVDAGFAFEGFVDDTVYVIGKKSDLKAAQNTGLLLQSMPMEPIANPRFAKHKTLDFPAKDSLFHNYTELTAELKKIADNSPNLVKLSSIGKSVQGREIPLLTFSTDGDDKARPAVIFMGGHHAREHLSTEVPLYLARYLAEQYKAGNQRVVSLLNSRTVYIAPTINPDGEEYDISDNNYHMWRKNRTANNTFSYGVDLNRNYGYMWGTGGSSADPNNETYKGNGPFSEPESRAVRDFVRGHENINVLLSFHSFSKLILYPWGHKDGGIEIPADFEVHRIMAEKMATWNGYEPMQSSGLYIASGDTTDWSYGELKIISFTFELDPAAGFSERINPELGFYPGANMVTPAFQKNLEPCLHLIENAANPYAVRGN